MEPLKELPAYLRFIILTLAACFAIGTVTHSIDIFQLGFFGYSKLPQVTFQMNIFWSSLIFLDPLVILLLFLRRNYGIVLGFFVLLADVAVNMNFILKHASSFTSFSPSVALQISALLFSLFTLPLWIGYSHGNRFKFYCRIFSFMPILSFSYWLFLHAAGIIRLFNSAIPPTLWNIWSQFSMFFLDGFIMVTLLKKTRIGLSTAFIALVLLSGEILVCAALALVNVITTPITISAGIALAMSFLSITALIMTKDNYLKIRGAK
jgi:hypothetical protein